MRKRGEGKSQFNENLKIIVTTSLLFPLFPKLFSSFNPPDEAKFGGQNNNNNNNNYKKIIILIII